MQRHNAAFLQRNVRTAWVKPIKNGGKKASCLRVQRMRNKRLPCLTLTGADAIAYLEKQA